MRATLLGRMMAMVLALGCVSVAGAAEPPAGVATSVISGGAGIDASAPTTAKRRPNVLVIMTDDVGYAASSTFGGPIPTPTFDALSAAGLRYTNFHTTALCSPTRAALLTGRNPHAVDMGQITERASGGPGYSSVIPKTAATVARVLRDNGYRTAAFGKYHLIPKWELSSVGPFDSWPTSMGFDYFYGFEPAMTDQFTPSLIENTSLIRRPADPDYFLERDLGDKAIHWLREVRAVGRGEPFFLYYAPGTAHAPVQAPREWVEKFRGRFDRGWDVEREEILARQKKLGIVPRDAALSARNAGVPAWNSLSSDEKKVAARLMEVYAAALSYADHQIGRVIEELRASGQLDDTLVVYIQGDNGASPEGGVRGSFNYYNSFNAVREDTAAIIRKLDELGGAESAPAIPTGWTNALDTPFPRWKMDASALGGVINGMVLSWPGGIRARGEIRRQFHFISDVAPTIYESLGITPPDVVDGARQQPLDGISMAYSFEAGAAPSRRRQQYFETSATMAMYSDGWWAGYRTAPGERLGPDLKSASEWELYDLQRDFSQTRNVAAEHPARLAELKELFRQEATRNNVFPIGGYRGPPPSLPTTIAPGRYTLYPGTERYSDSGFPDLRYRSWTMTVKVDIPADGGSGIVVNQGGRFSGWGLAFFEGVPQFIYRQSDTPDAVLRLAADKALTAGSHVIEIRVALDPVSASAADSNGRPPGRGGAAATLVIDGSVAAQGRINATPGPLFIFMYQGAAIGHSTGNALVDDYVPPFAFDGRIESVQFDLAPRP